MFDFIEDLKYGDGIKIKFGSFALTLARNNCGSDMPEILEKWYKNRTGKDLNLENPLTFNEKIQWLKLIIKLLLIVAIYLKIMIR